MDAREVHERSQPLTVYERSREGLLSLLARCKDDADLANRMIFAHMIGVMEAYLYERLLDLFDHNGDIRKRLAADRTVLETWIRDRSADAETSSPSDLRRLLQNALYHNLEVVEVLYALSLGSEFIRPEPALTVRLMEAVKIRHDCVHRNGRSLGDVLRTIDDRAILALCADVNSFVKHIEAEVSKHGRNTSASSRA